MASSLNKLQVAISKDPGLKSNVSSADMAEGLEAAATMDALLISTIDDLGLNDDGLISPEDMVAVSEFVQTDMASYGTFILAHGDDEGAVETGFHLLQGNGGTLVFQGRDFIDTVADAIYHYGFAIDDDGRYANEDGNQNEEVADVAGWLNYFMNGVNVVFGSSASEELGSGDYSSYFAAAADETFYAEEGNDKVWAYTGHDTVWTGTGHDTVGGGDGNDKMYGEDGRDVMWGDGGNDWAYGGSNHDELGLGVGNDKGWGGTGNDTFFGEDGRDSLVGEAGEDLLMGGTSNDSLEGGTEDDTLCGEAGNDKLSGQDGNDSVAGGDGSDRLYGSAGKDTLNAGEGTDVLDGGASRDNFLMWESTSSRDTLVFRAGDSGKTTSSIDQVEGFDSGTDKIDLSSMGPMTFEELDYAGGGDASCYYDGNYLRIDHTGEGATDMMVEFLWTEDLRASDFIFA